MNFLFELHFRIPTIEDQTELIFKTIYEDYEIDPQPMKLRDIAIMEILYGGGLRISEVCDLNLNNIDEFMMHLMDYFCKVLPIRNGKPDSNETLPYFWNDNKGILYI